MILRDHAKGLAAVRDNKGSNSVAAVKALLLALNVPCQSQHKSSFAFPKTIAACPSTVALFLLLVIKSPAKFSLFMRSRSNLSLLCHISEICKEVFLGSFGWLEQEVDKQGSWPRQGLWSDLWSGLGIEGPAGVHVRVNQERRGCPLWHCSPD